MQARNEANLEIPRFPETGLDQGYARGGAGPRHAGGRRAPVVTPASSRSRSEPGRNASRTPVGHKAEFCSAGPASEWRTRTSAAPILRSAGHELPAAAGCRQAQGATSGPSATRQAVRGLGQPQAGCSLPPRSTTSEASTTILRGRSAAALCQWRQRSPCISQLSPPPRTPPGPRAHSTARGQAVQHVPDFVSPKSMQAPGSARVLSWPRDFRSRSTQSSASGVGADRSGRAAVRHGKKHGACSQTAGGTEGRWQRFLERSPGGVPESTGTPTLAARLRAAQQCIAADWGKEGRGPLGGTQQGDRRDLKHRTTMEGAGSWEGLRRVHGTVAAADEQARTTRTVPAAADKPEGQGMPAPQRVRPASEHMHVFLLG